jgi:hypothetical protein
MVNWLILTSLTNANLKLLVIPNIKNPIPTQLKKSIMDQNLKRSSFEIE